MKTKTQFALVNEMNKSYLDVIVDEGGVPDPVVVDVDGGCVEMVVEKTSSGPVEGKQTNERTFTRTHTQQVALQVACLFSWLAWA